MAQSIHRFDSLTGTDWRSVVADIVDKNKTPIADLYGEWLWWDNELEKSSHPRDKDIVHASSLGYCARATVLEMTGSPHQKAAVLPTYRIFENGHSFHDRMQRALIELGVLYDAELKVGNDKYRIGGAIDGKMKVQGIEQLVEFKYLVSRD